MNDLGKPGRPTGDAPARDMATTPNPAHLLTERLAASFNSGARLHIPSAREISAALRQGGLGAFEAESSFAACLLPLLSALKWRGTGREIAEALPHFANTLDLAGLRNTLANLHFRTTPKKLTLSRLDPRLAPCLFITEDGTAWVILESAAPEGPLRIYDGGTAKERLHTDLALPGTAYFINTTDDHAHATASPNTTTGEQGWMNRLIARFKPTIWRMIGISFGLNIMALTVPLFIMALYDKVIPSRSANVLFYLCIGIALVLATETGLRYVRARLFAYVGARVDSAVGSATLEKILALPPSSTERAPVGDQLAHIREFESIREFFTGPLGAVTLDLPFVLFFITVIALLGGPLALIPIIMIGIYAIIGVLLIPAMQRTVAKASKARGARQRFLVETTAHLRTIKQHGAEQTWADRFREISAKAAHAHFRTTQFSNLFQALSHAIMLGAGVLTIVAGVSRVLDSAMTIGALVATMALIWRVLAPVQTGFIIATRIMQIKNGVAQVNKLMNLKTERDGVARFSARRRYAGALAFSRVSFRYRPEAQPALFGVDFAVPAGQFVAITGPNGAGKSTVLKLMTGMYRPQAGQMTIDGLDIRQIDPAELRQTIAYMPQERQLFHGTIAQNLRLADPTASDDAIVSVCRKVGVLAEIERLPNGFENRLGDQTSHHFSSSFLQRLTLARTFLRDAPAILLDEPTNGLDEAGDQAFLELLDGLYGRTTLFLVTHRPSHIARADRALVFENGMLVADDAPSAVLNRFFEDQTYRKNKRKSA